MQEALQVEFIDSAMDATASWQHEGSERFCERFEDMPDSARCTGSEHDADGPATSSDWFVPEETLQQCSKRKPARMNSAFLTAPATGALHRASLASLNL